LSTPFSHLSSQNIIQTNNCLADGSPLHQAAIAFDTQESNFSTDNNSTPK
jgi:hypothetical protein